MSGRWDEGNEPEDLDANRVGYIENEHKFRDTVRVYEKILQKEIELQIVKIQGALLEAGVPIPPKSTSNRIIMPNCIPTIAKEERDLYVLMERELSKHIAKYDRNNAIAFAKQYPDYPSMAYVVYNILENHRCESYLAELFQGSGFQLKEIMRRFVQREPQNLIEVLMAVAYRRADTVPKELEQEANEFDELLRKVENCSAQATHIIGNKVMQVIQDTLAKEGKEPEEILPGKGNPLAPENPFSNTKQQSDAAEREQDDIPQDAEPEQEQEPQESPQDQPDIDEGEGESESEGDSMGEKDEQNNEGSASTGDIQQEITDMMKEFESFANVEGTRLEQPEEIETQTAEIPENQTEEETLEQAEQQGEQDLEKLKENLEQALQDFDYKQLQKQEIDERDFTITSGGYNQKVVDKDPYSTLRVPKTDYDKATARNMNDAFKRIKGKTDFVRSNRGNKVVIKAYIQRRAGSANTKIFKRRQEEKGLAIAYCLDISGSMNAPFPKGGKSGKWTRKNVSQKKKIAKANPQAPQQATTTNSSNIDKLDAVRYILLTLYEATRRLENVESLMYAFADESTDEIYVPKLTRQRLTTIYGGGNTATHGAVRAAAEDLKKFAIYKKLMILITDGEPSNEAATQAEIHRAREAGIYVYTIIVERYGTGYLQYYLEKYARVFGEPNKHFSILTTMADFRRVTTRMVAKNVIDMLYSNVSR